MMKNSISFNLNNNVLILYSNNNKINNFTPLKSSKKIRFSRDFHDQ